MGLYYSKRTSSLFTASDHWLMQVKGKKVIKSLDNPYFNCVHGISSSMREDTEFVFVACTGIDAIIEIDLDKLSDCLWNWFATEHGYDQSANGQQRRIDRSINHQGIEYSTPLHTMHVNWVLQLNKDTILATLFHQGQLIAIDLATGNLKAKTIISKLQQPHGIYKLRNGGFLVCDTNGERIVFLDQFLHINYQLKDNFHWIQDARELEDSTVVIADANNYRLLRYEYSGKCIWEWDYDRSKRIGCLLPLSAQACKEIFTKGGMND